MCFNESPSLNDDGVTAQQTMIKLTFTMEISNIFDWNDNQVKFIKWFNQFKKFYQSVNSPKS